MTKDENLTDELTAVLEEIAETPTTENEVVVVLDEENLMINQRPYRLVTNYREGFNPEKLGERFSEVLTRYDYIVGDWGYDQLRLKGFFEATNKRAQAEQRIDTLQDYLYEYCNFGCAYFVVQRVGGKREKTANRRKKKPTSQAHIQEKKAPLSDKKKKPVIKSRPATEKKSNKSVAEKKPNQPKREKKEFTIRKRED